MKVNETIRRIKELIGSDWFTETDAAIHEISTNDLQALVELGKVERDWWSTYRLYRVVATQDPQPPALDQLKTAFGRKKFSYLQARKIGIAIADLNELLLNGDLRRYPFSMFQLTADSIVALRAYYAGMGK